MTVEQWRLDITARGSSTVLHAFSSLDDAATSPLVALDGQDTANELGVAHLSVPAEHSVNDHLSEGNLAHLYVRDQYVTSYIIRVPEVGVIGDPNTGRAGEIATYQLAHLLAVLEEGIVEPPSGMDKQPASQDRTFGFQSISLDDSGWATATDQGEWDVNNPSILIKYPTEQWIDPTARHITTSEVVNDPLSAPAGFWRARHHFSTDHDMFIACNQHADATAWMWIDELNVMHSEGNGLEGTPSTFVAPIQGFWLPAGDHIVAIEVLNYWKEPGYPLDVGPLEGESVTYDDDNTQLIACAREQTNEIVSGEIVYGDVIFHTDDTWLVSEVLDPYPGFTNGGIILQVLGEEQALGVLTDVECSFDATNDTGGTAWAEPVEVSTKSLTGLEQFLVKEMTDSLIDIDAHYDFDTNKIVIDAWNKGEHRSDSGLTLTEGANLGQLSLAMAPRAASQFAVQWNQNNRLSFHTVSEDPPEGTPARRRGLSDGAARTLYQVLRDGASQLEVFNRRRVKIELQHLTAEITPDEEMPPNYWKWSSIDVSLMSRWVESGTLDVIAVSFRLRQGRLEFTPAFGDLIIPVGARTVSTLRKMAPPSIGGQSRIATPVTLR